MDSTRPALRGGVVNRIDPGHGQGRRLKYVCIEPLLIQAWLKTGEIPRMILLSEKLPEDAMLVACTFMPASGLFVMVFESDEFPLVQVGREYIPEMETPKWGVLQEAQS